MKRPYEGLSVVEAVTGPPGGALRLAAAMTGRIFADLGAQVSQVEETTALPPGEGPSPWRVRNHSLARFLSTRKSTVHINPEDRESLRRAVRGADIAILDHKTHRTLGANELPGNIALLSLFGGRHAASDIPASEFSIAALGGLLNMIGDPGRKPLKLGGHQEAYALGLSAFCGLAVLAARQETTAAPRTVTANLLDTVLWLNWKSVPLDSGAPVPAGRAGASAEWIVLRCSDGWMALVYQQWDWSRLCDLVGDDRLRQSKFTLRQGRLEHALELARIVETVFLTRTRKEIHEQASSLRLPLGPVWDPIEVIEDPHNIERALFEELPLIAGERSPVCAPRLPVLWNGAAFMPTTERRQPGELAVSLP